jgi:serine/threonine protein kinase
VIKSCTFIYRVKYSIGIFITPDDIDNVTQEIVKMSQFDHPNVMKLLGVCVAPAEEGSGYTGPSMVMPFMARGNLLNFLRKESDNLFVASEEEVKRKWRSWI